MGCGKTITTIAVLGRAYLNNKIKRAIIIAPKSIVGVWQEEFEKFSNIPYTLRILTGSTIKKVQQLKMITGPVLQIAVINYDSLPLIEDELLKWSPDFIVADESTRIKNPGAKTSKAVHRIARKCRYRMILTGSPVTQNPLDLYSQYKMLDESIFGSSFYAFKNRYAVLGTFHQPIAYKNMPELIEKAHSISYRVTKAEALDLPETIDEIHPIILEHKTLKQYREFVKDSYLELSKGEVTATNILTRILRLQQMTGGFIRADDETERYEQVSSAKLEALEDILDSVLESGEKLVVMARFIPEIEQIKKLFENRMVGHATIHGSTRDRAEEIRRFQEDPECRVFLGQIQTTSMGITLTAASTCVFYSLSYNYADYIQAKARIHRIGQKNKCVYIHLVAKGTIDETVLTALQKKEDIAHSIVDNWKNIIT